MSTATVKDHPILFSSEMVRALLAGTKTQTRRIVKFHPSSGYIVERGGKRRWHRNDPEAVLACPYGVPGDRLWVRETWRDDYLPREYGEGTHIGYLYKADPDEKDDPKHPWKPSIHMPKKASRITLEITGVRKQQVQSISEEDARAEGVYASDSMISVGADADARFKFRNLWDRINGKSEAASWDANPWVWVVEFERLVPASAAEAAL